MRQNFSKPQLALLAMHLLKVELRMNQKDESLNNFDNPISFEISRHSNPLESRGLRAATHVTGSNTKSGPCRGTDGAVSLIMARRLFEKPAYNVTMRHPLAPLSHR